MYVLTINYIEGPSDCFKSDDFARIQEAVDSIDRLIDSLEVHQEPETDI